MIKYILFDFDGTLVNTNDIVIASWQHTYRYYLGYEVPVERIIRCFGEPLLTTMAREFPDVDPQESARVYRTFQKENSSDMVTLFPGVEELLQKLKEQGYITGIVTSRTQESASRYLKMLGITSYFDDMVNCEDTERHKPDPDPLLLCLERLGASPKEAVMVGDSPFDIMCAINAGVRSVLVDWRITGEMNGQTGHAAADFSIRKPMELMTVLKQLSEAQGGSTDDCGGSTDAEKC